MSSDYDPREHDHLIEPFFGAFEGERRVARRDRRRRVARLLAGALALGAVLGGLWLAYRLLG